MVMAMPLEVQPGQPVRPPRVEFETRAVEAGVVDGKIQYKDVDFVRVTPHGQYSVVEAQAESWIAGKKNAPYYDQLVRAYEAFKAGKEPPVNGTPIEMCTLFSPAEVKMMKTVGARAVEDMAAWPDGNLDMFGMGAVRLKQKAQAWLKAARDNGAGAAEMDAMRATIENQNATIANLQDQLRALAVKLEEKEGPRQKLSLKKGEAA